MNELATQSLSKPFDPSASTSLTGAAVAQLVDGLQPYLDKGMLIITEDVAGLPVVPDARDGGDNTNWQRYGWVRVQASSAALYVWNKNGLTDATYYKWVSVSSATVPDGSLTTVKYGFGSVTDEKIASVNWSKLVGPAPTLSPSGAATGDLTGNYPNPTIAANAVDGTKLKSDAISANRAVSALHVQDHSLALTRLAVNGTALTVPLGAADLSGFVEAPLPVLQFIAKAIAPVNIDATGGGALLFTYNNTVPTTADGTSLVSQVITPKSATSLIRVRFSAQVACSTGASNKAVVALFSSASANAIKTAWTFGVIGGTSTPQQNVLSMEAVFVSGTTAALTISLRAGPVAAAHLYVNVDSAAGASVFGASANSYITIEEIQGTLN